MFAVNEVITFGFEFIAVSGGAAAFSYFIFQHLGKKWIENKFAKQLADQKHDQEVELQRLRIEIDSLLSGALKLQEREFELLPDAWKKLNEAYELTRYVMSPGQLSADVGGMTNERLDEYLAKSEFLETQKAELRSSSNRNKTFQELSYWLHLRKANMAVFDIEQFIARNGIFFPLELKLNFVLIVGILHSALISHEVGHDEPRDRPMQAEGWKRITGEVEPLYKSIETEIQNRLRSHGLSLKAS